jgi:hypothetical protein
VRGRPLGSIQFTIPTWINQVISIEQPLETLIAGNKREPIRRKIRKLQKNGFSYRSSCAKEDFDLFYHRMYVPFVKSRHGEQALVASYPMLWDLWFKRRNGRLVLVTRDEKPLAGMICQVLRDTCYSIEGGVLDADSELFREGIWTFLNACIIDWGRNHGARWLNFGGTRAWCSDSVFESKRRWGARVVSRSRPVDIWTFIAQDIKPSLQAHLNRLGFISSRDGKFYRVYTRPSINNLPKKDVREMIDGATHYGLDGILAISANSGVERVWQAK